MQKCQGTGKKPARWVGFRKLGAQVERKLVRLKGCFPKQRYMMQAPISTIDKT